MMTTKSFFFVVAVAALVGAAYASCPNACSGHGSCGNHDRCKCYANYVGGDCSEKSCPYGRSAKECSGRGTCDRGSGTCECADGYTGASCQRISCPNDCSGKGSCDTTTGMCNCAGGYAGNDCGTRLCPKGDDPLTHEVENAGDGSASQTVEVQTVTFNAGRGLGGMATLTYNDLYGQSWTTRPFNVGGDNVYRLEIAIVPGSTEGAAAKRSIHFKYNGAKSDAVVVLAHATAFVSSDATITAELVRAEVEDVLNAAATTATTAATGLGKSFAGNDRASVVYVKKHHSATSAKIGGSIHAAARLTFDIQVPVDMSTHDDNGALLNGLSVEWGATPTSNTASLSLRSIGDRSNDIANALTSLPNQVIPSVTVSKNDVTDAGTTSTGASGNAYTQSYDITFNNDANAGDQNMLTCNAHPCDEDGCMNRGSGVAEVRYMYHDHDNYGEGINFNNKGYFIMDIGDDDASSALSAGSIKIMWDTGAGIDSAVFAVVATAAEVQSALRTINGWESVTVQLWGSRADPTATNDAGKLLVNHQFKVTFAAGYDDLGRSPTFKTLTSDDGPYATATNGPTAKLYDQRFSNSVWIGKTSGYSIYTSTNGAGTTNYVGIASLDTLTAIPALPENGDVWKVSDTFFGAGGANGAVAPATGGTSNSEYTLNAFKSSAMASGALAEKGTAVASGSNFAYLYEGATSQQSSAYFAIGSTIEVLGAGKLGATSVNNQYRKFKVTGHYKNKFNKEFAKLDSFPADDGTSATFNDISYLLKITSNNGIVRNYPDTQVRVNVQEVQILTIGTGAASQGTDEIFTLQYKGEETADLNYASTAAQVAEEINSFSALSGPVTVVATNANGLWTITFDAKDGDVALITAVKSAGTLAVNTFTKHHGWSIEAPVEFGLDTMQAGGKVNITAQEECTFALATDDDGTYYFCYDGVCGTQAALTNTPEASDYTGLLHSIKDDNGDQLLSTTVTVGTSPASAKVTMPLGKSCDGLELRAATAAATTAITKTVDKHNNGKQFGITRSFLHRVVPGTNSGFAAGKVTFAAEGALYAAATNIDSIIIGDLNACDAKVAGNGDVTYPINRILTTIAGTGAFGVGGAEVDENGSGKIAADGTITDGGFTAGDQVWIYGCTVATNNGRYRASSATVLKDFHTGNAVTLSATDTGCKRISGLGIAAGTANKCVASFGRHVITLDSIPTVSAYSVTKSLEFTSPVGSCSVAETTKGSFESYECSNRGACDGKSGVCACYEGYSGQSCQQQTVLV